MKFPFFNIAQNNNNSYLGILLLDDKAVGYIYELNGKSVNILAQHSSPFSDGFKNIVEDIDDILFRLETDTNKKLKKTIFFVTSEYVDETTKEIKKDFKLIIKNLVKELELEALGFIECYEAVGALTTKTSADQSGNVILIELKKDKGDVFVYIAGSKAHSGTFLRTDNLTHDLTKAFINIQTTEPLPSRIVLYPFKESHKELVHLVNHKWSEDLFIKHPHIEALAEEDFQTDLANIFASQILDNNEVVKAESQAAAIEEKMDSDIDEPLDNPVDEQLYQKNSSDELTEKKEVLGFVIGGEAIKTVEDMSPPITAGELATSVNAQYETYGEQATVVKPKRSLPSFKIPMKWPVFLLVFLGFILSGLFISEYYLHKATVSVTFPSETIKKEMNLNSSLNIKAGNIAASITESVATTGKRDIGEKAKGDVTLLNFEDKERTISKGTTLESDGKKFILDQDVKIASSSVSSDSLTKVAGQGKGSVTADVIGLESNLDKGKKFKIGDLSVSSYSAINPSAFTGGTKRQAQTVAKKDLDDLEAKALEMGKKQGLDDMRKKISSDQQIIDDLTEQSLEDVDFSKEVGDEAKEVTITANVETKYYTYSDNDLKKVIQENLQGEVKSGYSLPLENISLSVSKAEKDKDDEVQLTVDTEGKSVRSVPQDEITALIKGKSKDEADFLLKSKLKAEEIVIKNEGISIFPFSSRIPMSKKNIKIEINSL